jgi:hypothetical protein
MKQRLGVFVIIQYRPPSTSAHAPQGAFSPRDQIIMVDLQAVWRVREYEIHAPRPKMRKYIEAVAAIKLNSAINSRWRTTSARRYAHERVFRD